MAYNELIKNFERIRDYMREFYVCGFKSREEYDKKSARSYDDERRRIESWLGDYMGFRQTPEGKNVFLAIDSRLSRHNPLYKAWKAKSFTDGDITLHFLIFDILDASGQAYSLNEMMEKLDGYFADANVPKTFDTSTVRKKLQEYVGEGLVCTVKQGKTLLYRRAEMTKLNCADALNFFSETAPCGVIGSFLLDRAQVQEEYFAFKHHYITQALDDDILCSLFEAMRQKRAVTLKMLGRRGGEVAEKQVVPLRIFVSVQNGRQYLLAHWEQQKRIWSFRIDRILSVKLGELCEGFENLRAALDRMQQNMWGVSTQGGKNRLERVEFTILHGDGEEYIYNRLVREKRCGQVERLNAHTSRFVAEVYDASELIPWIRTFLCRIVSIHFSNEALEKRFRADLEAMYRIYGIPEDKHGNTEDKRSQKSVKSEENDDF